MAASTWDNGARPAAGIDGLVENNKVDDFALDLVVDPVAIEDGTGEAVKPCHDKLVHLRE